MLTAFGTTRTNGLPLELCGLASHLSFVLRESVRHAEASNTRLGASVDQTEARSPFLIEGLYD